MQVIPNMFHRPGEDGDFGWMIEQSEYDDALFIFNDNQEQFLDYLKSAAPGSTGCTAGMNNAVIRPYQCLNPPRAAGVPTGSNGEGYSGLTPEVKRVIGAAFGVIRETAGVRQLPAGLLQRV